MNYCPKCRKKLIVQDFCVECGTDLSEYLNNASQNISENIFGGADISALKKEAQKQLQEQQRLQKFKDEFEIENGILKKYKGKGGKVIIPREIKIVGEEAFCENNNIVEIVFEEGVEEIASFAFRRAKSLKKVDFPQSLKKIGYGAFLSTSIEEIVLYDGIQELVGGTFYHCEELKRVELPNTLKKIGENTFCSTEKLLTLFIPKSVQIIEGNAFGSSGLVDIYFEAAALPEGAAKDIDGPIYRSWDTECYAAVHYSCKRNEVSILDYDVEAKNYGSDLENYNKNDFFKDNPYFVYCKREMSTVKFPYGVPLLEDYMIEKSLNITTLILPKATTRLGDFLFGSYRVKRNKLTLTSVYAEGITVIGSGAFEGCEHLHDFYGKDSMKEIGECAFEGCTNLTNFTLPTYLNKLGYNAFRGVPAFRNIKTPLNLLEIPDSAFFECPNLESVEISEGVTKIGNHAFCNCPKLKRVTISSTVKEIGDWAFSGCESLEVIELPEGIRELNRAVFQNCKRLKAIKIPYSIISLNTSDWETFKGCTSLEFVYVPRGRKEAFMNAFLSSYLAPNLKFIEY